MITLDTVLLVLFILLVHWIADFVMQTEEEAKKKSIDNDKLLEHTLTYSFVWFWASLLMFYIFDLKITFLWFAPITFMFHTTTDYITSRLNKKYWDENKYHPLIVSVGFDQFLHYVQLFFTYWILTK